MYCRERLDKAIQMSLLIKDCSWIVTQDSSRNVLTHSSIYVQDGRIAEIGTATSHDADHVINGRNMIVLPGLINTHTHIPMTIFRGYADDMPLQEWLGNKIWKLESHITGDTCYWGGMLACMEMIASGTVTFNDMYFYVEDVARAVIDSGLRAVLSSAILETSTNPIMQKPNAAKMLEFLKELHNPLVTPAIAPHAHYTCTDETLLWAKEVADRDDLLVHTHIAETKIEQTDSEKNRRMTVVEHLDKIGFLGSNVVGAHCVWLSRSEIKTLGRTGTKVAHCPVSNMKLAVGAAAPILEMEESKVSVGLGTDGAASNNTLDMFETMKFCALLHKHTRWDPTVLPAQLTLDLATIEGAKVIGLDAQVGSIEKGKRADLIMLDGAAPNLMPIHGRETIISDLVYSAKGANVDTTIVNGRVLMERRQFKTIDTGSVFENVKRVAEEMLARSANR